MAVASQIEPHLGQSSIKQEAASTGQREPRTVTVLGATGSVGLSTLDLIGRNRQAFEVVALTANRNASELARLAIEHRARLAVVADADSYGELKACLAGTGIEAAAGEAALVEAAARDVDWTMAAIVGAAGLKPTFAAARRGGALALANKECLVSAGSVFMRAMSEGGGVLLPVDSEHSAAFQLFDQDARERIERIVITASGGPFRTWSRAEIEAASPEQALKHPNWSMGPKITIDSATLMNKGLEIIEAFHLFGLRSSQLAVVVHPQSIVHCMVEYADGSVLAHLGAPDMRTPIAYSLAWPSRMHAPTERLDLARIGKLTFEEPDGARFPALGLARAALERGGTACTVLNGANEVAVEAFLARRLGFYGIAELVAASLEAAEAQGLVRPPGTLAEVLEADTAARALARGLLPRYARDGR
jgi:1-deoxy-D-xylulose-5-phosphate reductoisomerase